MKRCNGDNSTPNVTLIRHDRNDDNNRTGDNNDDNNHHHKTIKMRGASKAAAVMLRTIATATYTADIILKRH